MSTTFKLKDAPVGANIGRVQGYPPVEVGMVLEFNLVEYQIIEIIRTLGKYATNQDAWLHVVVILKEK